MCPGIRPATGEAGDLYAEIAIVIPKQMDEESADLVRRLDQRLAQSDVRAELAW